MGKSKQQSIPTVQRAWTSVWGTRSTRFFKGDTSISDARQFAYKANRCGFTVDVGWFEKTGALKQEKHGFRLYAPPEWMRQAEPLGGMSDLVEIGFGALDFYVHRLLNVWPPGRLNRVYDCHHFQYTCKGIARAKRLIAEWQGELPK